MTKDWSATTKEDESPNPKALFEVAETEDVQHTTT